jgi:hypothetical protein
MITRGYLKGLDWTYLVRKLVRKLRLRNLLSIRSWNLSYFTSLVKPRALKLGGPILN